MKYAFHAFWLSGFLAITGCATTNEMTLAPNVVRLDTQASGLLFTGSAGAMTMKRAAEVTLQRGYSHFTLDQASMSSGSAITGVDFNTGFANRTPTANVGVTVTMHRGPVGNAWDAADVLKRGGNV